MEVHKYGASWCSPCKQLSRNLLPIDFSKENITLVEHDVDLMDRSELIKLGIRGVPTLILVRDGVEIGRKTGALTPDELRKFLMIGE